MVRRNDLKANIGCQSDSWGDIRLDIRRSTTATIIADAQNLPFRQGAFNDTKMSHVLEHLDNPSKALAECVYATNHKIIIAFPTETDEYPTLIRYLFSLPFSIRGVSRWCKNRRAQEHKWVIKPKAVTDFLAKSGWETTCTREKGKHLLTIFESKRTPRRLKRFVKYLPHIGSQYVIIAKKSVSSVE